MLVVAAGCSHVFGSDLDDVRYPHPSQSVWPKLVANRLGAECINVSKIAGGNHAILRRTIITLHDLIENQKVDPKDILLLVQFSYWNRLELFNKEFQWCGSDFPYVTTKFISDALVSNSKRILEIIKSWLVSTDLSYIYLSSLQSVVMLNLWADKLGVKTYSAFTEDVPKFDLPEYATVGDNKIGLSEWDKIHTAVSKQFFHVHDIGDLKCYKLAQKGRQFDTQSAIMNTMLNCYKDQILTFGEHTNWIDFCKLNEFTYKKRLWEQGDNDFRTIDQIKRLVTGERKGNGHWGEDAHLAAADIIYEQVKAK